MHLFRRKYDNFEEVIKTAPGPSPWYLRSTDIKLPSNFGELGWVEIGETGYVALKTVDGSTLAILGMYCYVRSLLQHRILVWHEEYNEPVKFYVIDLDRLKIIEKIEEAVSDMKKDKKKVLASNGEIPLLIMPIILEEGSHHFEFPEIFKEIDELLVLFHPNPSSDKMNLCLMIIHPQQNMLEVVPQQWYNEGNLDFGYQWVTRVARDPATKRIFGEGFRIGEFVLDEKNKNIEKPFKLYLPFYHHPRH